MSARDAFILVAAWCGYFALHSLLASLWLKRWVAAHKPAWLPGYRLGYNLVAIALLVVPLWLTFAIDSPVLWQWQGFCAWLANALAVAALLAFVWSLRYYDGAEFMGLRQWQRRQTSAEDQERLYISPLHRFVRHPWYSLGLVLMWTRDMNVALFITAVTITLYFVVGSRLEERKLVVYHGDAYREYRRRVPALVPRPWQFLTKAQADDLLARWRGRSN
ncbi:MAG: hypothetical protein AMJ69_00510 [Gammaproteobacteria bacterium SG8_47]|nr:MAG: hypothetical protein AMJ69_00510 [Gammaproteobacteria bacterium SG8_47]